MSQQMIQARLAELGLSLPEIPTPSANYVPFKISGRLLYLSGQGPCLPDGTWRLGKVGAEVSSKDAYRDARVAGLRLLAVAQSALGSLDRVTQVVKLLGLVNATPDFTDHPQVINGCSDLMVEVFADKGRHARSAIGVASLPRGMTVEIEAILEID